jgi:DNA-damage-inducible protein D
MPDLQVFHFEDGRPNFEAYAHDTGFRHWLASDLMKMLDYTSMGPIKKAMNKAMAACANLGVAISENFKETQTDTAETDWCLSRFACYLTVMNGDSRNPKIALAQGYFVAQAEAFREYIQQADDVERVLIRGEVSDREKALSGTANAHGVINYAYFQNAGYRGMYNMDFRQLVRRKGVPDGRSILDFMGKTELAANLFRITQTEEKIRNQDIHGQSPLERAHEAVGREVRDTMRRIGGTLPENLALSHDIKKVRSGLKRAGKEFAKLDGPKKEKRSTQA